VVKYAQAQRAAGIPIEKIGEEVGVPWRTIRRWLSDARRGRFHAVEIEAQPRAAVVVHGPHGIRVEGLDLDSVAELLRRLA
jgi:predicted transcriptional regulator